MKLEGQEGQAGKLLEGASVPPPVALLAETEAAC